MVVCEKNWKKIGGKWKSKVHQIKSSFIARDDYNGWKTLLYRR